MPTLPRKGDCMTCTDCVYVVRVNKKGEDRKKSTPPDFFCHRYPPTPLLTVSLRVLCAWPEVSRDDHCGEFERVYQ